MLNDLIQIHVSVPDALTGEVLQKLNELGGTVTGLAQKEHRRTGIEETLPRAHLVDFEIWLMKFSDGEGKVSER